MLGHTENQGGHKRKPPQSSSNSYFQHNRSDNCNNVLDYDNPEKLFPYAGIPDLTRICLHEICSATDLHEFCPGEHFTSNKPRNSKVETQFTYEKWDRRLPLLPSSLDPSQCVLSFVIVVSTDFRE
ncbi:hypothetical protein HF325_001941 [Metschnikowia pulcherrima]|uniref:Uncharacterized protein n=1 Tax=Metschnikowia pulcherrima TaxID=27326 RepID=A0A8H7GZA9_9ASCO|nr:hypothetical protein HF325_001941 [Metschnikowia pulcherrima]